MDLSLCLSRCRAAIFSQLSAACSFFILLSWLPTFFKETFPGSKVGGLLWLLQGEAAPAGPWARSSSVALTPLRPIAPEDSPTLRARATVCVCQEVTAPHPTVLVCLPQDCDSGQSPLA